MIEREARQKILGENNRENHVHTLNDHVRPIAKNENDNMIKEYTTRDVNLINISVLVEVPQLLVCMIVIEQFLPQLKIF